MKETAVVQARLEEKLSRKQEELELLLRQIELDKVLLTSTYIHNNRYHRTHSNLPMYFFGS